MFSKLSMQFCTFLKKIVEIIFIFLLTSYRKTDTIIFVSFELSHAGVAELADAQASGACGSNTVRVQVPPSAFFCFLKRIAGMNKRVRPKGLGSFFVWWL